MATTNELYRRPAAAGKDAATPPLERNDARRQRSKEGRGCIAIVVRAPSLRSASTRMKREMVNCFSYLSRATPYICILLSESEMLATEDWSSCTN
jgi:hypothetical protein